jgi:hypothetical protein
MATLVVPSVLLVLIGTCPYFLSTTREIVVCGKREPYKAVQGDFRYRLSRKRERGVEGAYRGCKGGMGSLTGLYREHCVPSYTELYRLAL